MNETGEASIHPRGFDSRTVRQTRKMTNKYRSQVVMDANEGK